MRREDAPAWQSLRRSDRPDIWIRLPRHDWPKSWSNFEEPVLLEQNPYGHPPPVLLWEDNSIKFCWTMDGRKYQTGNACLCIVSKVYSCLYTWMTSNWLEGSRTSVPCRRNSTSKKLPTAFLDHVYSGCTQRECKPNECIIDERRKMFESRISAGATEKLPDWEQRTRSLGPVTWKDMRRDAWNDIASQKNGATVMTSL